MKRLFLVLMLSVMVGACGESTTDVATGGGGGGTGGDPGFIPPDTVIKAEHATLNGYNAGNPVAIASVGALTARSAFTGAVDAAADNGYGFDPADVAVASGQLDDGRDVLIAIAALPSVDHNGFLFYVRMGDVEHAIPVRARGHGDDSVDILESALKNGGGPSNMPWYYGDLLQCITAAMADISVCLQNTCPSCRSDCVRSVLVRFVVCIVFGMY